MQIHVGKVHKGLLKRQDLWLQKSLIHGLWKLEVCTRGSTTVCFLVYFLQPSTASWCPGRYFVDQLSLHVSPVEAGTSHEMEING